MIDSNKEIKLIMTMIMVIMMLMMMMMMMMMMIMMMMMTISDGSISLDTPSFSAASKASLQLSLMSWELGKIMF